MKTKLRLLFRVGQGDANGVLTGHRYTTETVELSEKTTKRLKEFASFHTYDEFPEVLGGEWIEEETESE